jgi:hypothetical protein
MKIINQLIRTVIILAVALIVSAASIGIVNSTSSGTQNNFGGERRPQFDPNRQPPQNGNIPQRGGEFSGERGAQGFSWFGVAGLGADLLKISIIVLPFAIYSTVQQKRRREKAVTATTN